jgi:hypothetical protein
MEGEDYSRPRPNTRALVRKCGRDVQAVIGAHLPERMHSDGRHSASLAMALAPLWISNVSPRRMSMAHLRVSISELASAETSRERVESATKRHRSRTGVFNTPCRCWSCCEAQPSCTDVHSPAAHDVETFFSSTDLERLNEYVRR